nr:UDP-N-acetylglucosamine 2-epimerase (non-hydrolyzing) [Bacteroidota bacterium]
MKILCIMGTRPEVIKMAPVILLLQSNKLFKCFVCITSQHKELLEEAMQVFGLKADYDLDIMMHNQDSFDVSVKILGKIKPVITKTAPDLILIQGDTHTAFIGALAGFYSKIRIGHIEAGLRTYRRDEPYPEELNRQMISRLAELHFAPTQTAKQNLLNENIEPSGIYVTGNTGIDALNHILNNGSGLGKMKKCSLFPGVPGQLIAYLNKPHKNLVLVTMHRRENIGTGIANVCKALKNISLLRDVVIVFSV